MELQRNYNIYNKEMLTVVNALEAWHHLLEGAPHKIWIISDHQNLVYWTTARDLTRRQARWALYLSRFNFEIEHRPGASLGKPNALS